MSTSRKSLFYLSIICFAVYVSTYLFSTKMTVADEQGFNFFSSLLVEHGTLKSRTEGDQIFGLPGFIPGQTVYNESGEAIPRQPPGFIILAAIAKAVTPGQFYLVLNPLLGVVCVLLVYGIGRDFLGSDQSAFYAALLFASTPVFIHWTQMFYMDIANLAVFLCSIWCLLKSMNTRRAIFLAGFSLSLGAMIWIRQTSVILLIPIAVFMFLNRKKLVFKWNWYLLPVVCFGLVIALLMTYNAQIYGSPFRTGYTMYRITGHTQYRLTAPVQRTSEEQTSEEQTSEEQTSEEQTSDKQTPVGPGRIKYQPTNTVSSILYETYLMAKPNYRLLKSRLQRFFPSFTLAFPPLVLALIGLIIGLKHPEKRNVCILSWITLVILFVFFSRTFPGYGYSRYDMTLQSSSLRYMLPFFALLSIPAVWVLEKLNSTRFRWVLLLVLLNVGVASLSHFGIIHLTLNRLYMEDVSRFVLQNTDSKTVVISGSWNHKIYPDRMVWSSKYVSEETYLTTMNRILKRGYNIAFILNKSEDEILEELAEYYTLTEKVTGPDELHILLQLLPVPLPSRTYPVDLYRILPEDQVTTN